MKFWISRTALLCLAVFFLIFGIGVLQAAYNLTDPGYFIMTFFASNLIILISATLAFGFILAMIRRIRSAGRQEKEDDAAEGSQAVAQGSNETVEEFNDPT